MASKRRPKRSAKPPVGEQLTAALREASRFVQRSYVTGLGIGEPSKNGRVLEGELAVCVHVREKFPEELLGKHQIFPQLVNDVRLDVEQRYFLPRNLSDEEILLRRIFPANPAMPGVEVGLENSGGGTLGLLVYDRTDGRACLLSAAHVLSGTPRATVYQPGWDNEAQPIGTVRRTLWNGHGDATIAVLDRHRPLDNRPLLGVEISGVRHVRPGDVLEKSGATTGLTRARVKTIGGWEVPYYDRGPIWMQGFELRPVDPADLAEISDGGDSGSVWYDPETGEGVGMTVAGDRLGPATSDEWTFCCHLDTVFDKLLISLDPNDRL